MTSSDEGRRLAEYVIGTDINRPPHRKSSSCLITDQRTDRASCAQLYDALACVHFLRDVALWGGTGANL
jgi:hypothetical protein